jgi:enoyl-CoA hydratase/carnithine racemase
LACLLHGIRSGQVELLVVDDGEVKLGITPGAGGTQDKKEGVAAFLEKRDPKFTGR